MSTLSARTVSRLIEPLVSTWTDDGAAGFSIKVGDQETSVGLAEAEPRICSPILAGRLTVGELAVAGPRLNGAERRLRADAALLGAALDYDAQLQRMTAELAECQDQLVAVFELARAARGRIDIDDVLAILVAEARDLAGAVSATVAFEHDDDLRIARSGQDVELDRARLRNLLGAVRSTGRSIQLPSSELLGSSPETAPATVLAVPVHVEREIQAMLAVTRRGDDGFSAGMRTLLEVISTQAGGLIESALSVQQALQRERIQRDMELAAVVQRTLISRATPAVPGLELARRYVPASQIGGDLYDLHLRRDGLVALTVADVTGKGVPAALVMSMLRTALHGSAVSANDPATAMNCVNRDLYDELTDLNTLVTACMCFVDPVRKLVHVANFGHSPVVHRPSVGPARFIDADAPPLGVIDDDLGVLRVEPLGPDDLLVVGTDGITEATAPDGAMYGYERLLQLVERERCSSAEQLADAILEDVARFAGGAQQADDVALVVAKGVTA